MSQRLTSSERKHRRAQQAVYSEIVGDFERDKRRLHDLAAKMIDGETVARMIAQGKNPLRPQ